MLKSHLPIACLVLCIGVLSSSARAAKLIEVRTVDDEIVMVHWCDGEVEWKDTGTGPTAFKGLDSAGEVIHKFPPPLNTTAAVNVDNYMSWSPRATGNTPHPRTRWRPIARQRSAERTAVGPTAT